MKEISTFQRKKDFLVCIDSDGTVLDAMEVKHRLGHCSALIEVFGLQDKSLQVQKIWYDINLYTYTRGINRFPALLEFFSQAKDIVSICQEDLDALRSFIDNAQTLSEDALAREIKATGNAFLGKVMRWSKLLNQNIGNISVMQKPPYRGVKEALEKVHKFADIAVVSSAGYDAIAEEWVAHDLDKFVDVYTCQELGSKAYCISLLLKYGYDKSNVIMIGDAFGDSKAADSNVVWYYPILVTKEEESWIEFKQRYLDEFLQGQYMQWQSQLKEKFEKNLERK